MDLTIMNSRKVKVKTLDVYESLLWTDRYDTAGDFEIYTAMSKDALSYFKQDYYITRPDTEHAMIIEKLLIEADAENGNHITITGRSLESMLDRRVLWGRTLLTKDTCKSFNLDGGKTSEEYGILQNGIYKMLLENVISPTYKNRKIPGFEFKWSNDERIKAMDLEAEYTGDNLYDVITTICKANNIGFKITFNESFNFVFELYEGTDRSYAQTKVPWVIFSPSFENIVNSNYMETKTTMRNVSLVGGEGEYEQRFYGGSGGGTGLERRELFVDARDISRERDDEEETTEETTPETGEEEEMTWEEYRDSLLNMLDNPDSEAVTTYADQEYLALLKTRGDEKLAENPNTVSFEGEAETLTMFTYGKDFFVGDVVQVANEYGHETTGRVMEIVTSISEEGYSTYPTFETITDDQAGVDREEDDEYMKNLDDQLKVMGGATDSVVADHTKALGDIQTRENGIDTKNAAQKQKLASAVNTIYNNEVSLEDLQFDADTFQDKNSINEDTVYLQKKFFREGHIVAEWKPTPTSVVQYIFDHGFTTVKERVAAALDSDKFEDTFQKKYAEGQSPDKIMKDYQGTGKTILDWNWMQNIVESHQKEHDEWMDGWGEEDDGSDEKLTLKNLKKDIESLQNEYDEIGRQGDSSKNTPSLKDISDKIDKLLADINGTDDGSDSSDKTYSMKDIRNRIENLENKKQEG